jgi:hypothetical protein
MLYWAEGDKSHKHSVIEFGSAARALLPRFPSAFFGLTDERVRLTCHLFADHADGQIAIEQFWLRTLGLPQTCLRPSVVNVYSKYSHKKRKNKLPFGTCRLEVNDTRIAQSIYGSIQEYGGFTRPE